LKARRNKYTSLTRRFLKKMLPLNFIWLVRNYSRIRLCFLKERPDLVIIGGGQLLLPERFSMASFLWVWLAKINKVNIVFSNVGFGGDFNYIEKRLTRYAIENSAGVNFRDEKSCKRALKLFPMLKNYVVSSDIVFIDYRFLNLESIGNGVREKILLGLTDLNVYNKYNRKLSRESYYRKWMSFLESIDVNVWQVSLIYTTEEDYIEACLFNEYLTEVFGRRLLVEDYNKLDEFKVLLAKSKLVISGRMHALILGLNEGCGIRGFPISPKVTDFESELSNSLPMDLANTALVETKSFLAPFIMR
jgi:polysaccharide pyruvyl transferase WcaK-like protein